MAGCLRDNTASIELDGRLRQWPYEILPHHNATDQVALAADNCVSRRGHSSTHALTTDQPCTTIHAPVRGLTPANYIATHEYPHARPRSGDRTVPVIAPPVWNLLSRHLTSTTMPTAVWIKFLDLPFSKTFCMAS